MAAGRIEAVQWPATGTVSSEWVVSLCGSLEAASHAPAKRLPRYLPASVLLKLLTAATDALSADETLVQLQPPHGTRVTVVGDTHGQLHDVLRLFQLAGWPSPESLFVLNGDYVDRGAWSVEVLAVMMAWKVALPHCVVALRGNHESEFATMNYGFHKELVVKYGAAAKGLYTRVLKLFSCLPLAARVGPGEGRTLVCHGGLFRAPPPAARRDALKQAEQDEAATQLPLRRLGTLQQLRAGSRGGRDPDGIGHSQLAADVLWSDPRREDGVVFNALRGIGLVYGPDATAAFLADNGLTLVIRSHEGPDARDQREGMGSMQGGWCVDHDTPAGRLATLFSAPDYPQFSAEGETRYNNTAAIAVLTGPHYDAPEILNFQAAPRPPAVPYYDLGIAGSDEEGPDGALAAGAAAAAAPADASEPAAEPVAAPAVVPQVEAEPAAAAVPEEEHAAEPEIASVPEPATQQVAEPAAEPASEPSAELQPVAEPAEAEPVAVLAAPELVLPPEPEAAAMFDAPDEAAAMPELQ